MTTWGDLWSKIQGWAPALISAGLLALYLRVTRWMNDYQEGREEKSEARGDGSERDALLNARANLDATQKVWLDAIVLDSGNTKAENVVLRRDRDRGWDLARAWRSTTQEERQEVNRLRALLGMPPLPALPDLEDIDGEKP